MSRDSGSIRAERGLTPGEQTRDAAEETAERIARLFGEKFYHIKSYSPYMKEVIRAAIAEAVEKAKQWCGCGDELQTGNGSCRACQITQEQEAVEEEREACAKVAEQEDMSGKVAAAIRGRK